MRAENRAHSQRMKAWAFKQAKREIALYKDVLLGGAMERHVTVESWIKRADHPQSKAKWRRGTMTKEKPRLNISLTRIEETE